MKRIDLGEGAVAFEASVTEDRVDMVSDEFFKRNNVSQEATRIYEKFRSGAQGTPPSPLATPSGAFKINR